MRDGHDALAAEIVLDLIEQIQARHPRINARSVDFLEDMADRAERFELVFFSEKQWAWFMNLAAEARVEVDA